MRPEIEILTLSGAQVRPYLAELAQLRIEIFREFPYLYEGTEAYERDYLEVYATSGRSVVVLALENSILIGASTGLPLAEADEAFQRPFVEQGIDPAQVFYFGESLVKQSKRGQGMGHEFFDQRERHARAHGFLTMAFCAVERPEDHPMKPDNHRANDAFWGKRGYRKVPNLIAELTWKQVDQEQEICNRLGFWLNHEG